MEETQFEGIQELCESRLFRSTSFLRHYNARDIADLIYLYVNALVILKQDFDTAPFSKHYSRLTLMRGDWDSWHFGFTDLAAMIHTLFGKQNQLDKLKDQDKNEILMDRITFNRMFFLRWLRRSLIFQEHNPPHDRRYLMRLERELNIQDSNYRAIRRIAPDWENANQRQRQLAMTRLIMAIRRRAMKSEILPVLMKVSTVKNYILDDATNPEPTHAEKEQLSTRDLMGRAGLGVPVNESITSSASIASVVSSPWGNVQRRINEHDIKWAIEKNKQKSKSGIRINQDSGSYEIVYVDPKKLFDVTYPPQALDYNDPNGGTNSRPPRLKSVKNYILNDNYIDPPTIHVHPNKQNILFADGRHRTLAAIQLKAERIPVLILSVEKDKINELVGIIS